MSWWEAIYLPEIVRGLSITSRHFFSNLAGHIVQLFGRGRSLHPAVTIQYPEVVRPLPERTRTLHRLTKHEDGSPRCVACMMCESACPAFCIFIQAGEHPDPTVEKYPVRFDIDLSLCIMCGYCVEACPEDAIRMDTGIVELSAYRREDLLLTIDQLLRLEPVDRNVPRPMHPIPPREGDGTYSPSGVEVPEHMRAGPIRFPRALEAFAKGEADSP
jgi:NADH-quinone oxidoreductase subunit I